MWSLTIKNPDSEPVRIKLRPGKMVIGRKVTSDIVITDSSASRRHAEIYLDSLSEIVTIIDLKSSNGTYVNRQRITGLFRLQNNDVIRIGQTVMHLTKHASELLDQPAGSSTRLFTRELVLEAVDQQPILLYEMARKLNSVLDVNSAISQVVDLIKRATGVDVCEIILAKDFNQIDMDSLGNLKVKVIRNSSVEMSPLALCVPIISDKKPLGLIYMEKKRPEAIPFEESDVQLAVAISHQTALTLQRMELLEKVQKDEQVKQLLLRFVSPIEAEYMLKDYLRTGNLPALSEKKVTVLYIEIADSAKFAQRIGPKYFSSILNNFYQFTTQAVFKKGGMAKYLGDGVIAVFMETQDKLCPEERAVSVALQIIDYVKNLRAPESDQACVIGAAINTGKAMVGYVGTQERAEFNVMGDLIKVTYRMQEYARPNRIFVGAKTVEPLINRYQIKKAGDLTVPGHDEPTQVYEIALARTAPFIVKEGEKETEKETREEIERETEKETGKEIEEKTGKEREVSSAFKEVAERLRARLKDRGR